MAFSCVSSAQTCSSRRLMFTTTRPKFEVASIRLLTSSSISAVHAASSDQ
jgi:hypothetical protein